MGARLFCFAKYALRNVAILFSQNTRRFFYFFLNEKTPSSFNAPDLYLPTGRCFQFAEVTRVYALKNEEFQ